MHRDPAKLTNRQFDVLVIGGGIYGAFIAWDAAQRGLSVALVEEGDFGQGTSANSLKTVHGGLRYLQDFDLELVREMVRERSTYLRIAPHLVQPLKCITPTYQRLTKSKLVMATALKLSDLAAFDRNKTLDKDHEIPSSYITSEEECKALLPGLCDQKVTGGAVWYDAQIYDTERFTLAVITSAEKAGAEVCNYVRANRLLMQSQAVKGATVADTFTNDEFEVRSKVVINCAGPWIDTVIKEQYKESGDTLFQPSLAVNIITKTIVADLAAGVPSWRDQEYFVGTDKKVSHMLFISPWRGKSIIGTFHSHYQNNPSNFSLQAINLQEIIQETNSAYPAAELEVADIEYAHYGFLPEKPYVQNSDVRLVRKSRIIDHQERDGLSGLFSVIGVKYTTARHTAEKIVDLVFDFLKIDGPSSSTSIQPIHGGENKDFGGFLSQAIQSYSARLSPETIKHLVQSYGTDYLHLIDLITDEEKASPLDMLSEPVIKAQVTYAVQEEMAVTLSDVIFRRTGIGTTGFPGEKVLETTANIMASEMRWSPAEVKHEIKEVQAHYWRHSISI